MFAAQTAFARRQYMVKHFSPAHRVVGMAALGLGYALRAVVGSHDPRLTPDAVPAHAPRWRRSWAEDPPVRLSDPRRGDLSM